MRQVSLQSNFTLRFAPFLKNLHWVSSGISRCGTLSPGCLAPIPSPLRLQGPSFETQAATNGGILARADGRQLRAALHTTVASGRLALFTVLSCRAVTAMMMFDQPSVFAHHSWRLPARALQRSLWRTRTRVGGTLVNVLHKKRYIRFTSER